jgi:hypothetical protein
MPMSILNLGVSHQATAMPVFMRNLGVSHQAIAMPVFMRNLGGTVMSNCTRNLYGVTVTQIRKVKGELFACFSFNFIISL